MLALALLLLSVPDPSPPPEDSVAAAVQLWAEHPPRADERESAISITLATAAEEGLILIGRGRSASQGPEVGLRYGTDMARLEARLAERIPHDRTVLDKEVARCAADGVARALSPAEIANIRGVMATPSGDRFWVASGLSTWPLIGCYRAALRIWVTDEDYRAIGLEPPAKTE